MSNFLTVSTISYTPPDNTGLETGDWQKLLHKELKELVGNCTRSTQPDLIVLPEALLRNLAEPVPSGSTSQVLARLARKHNCWITVPVHQREPRTGNIFNVLALLDRQGKLAGIYRKTVPYFEEFDLGIRSGPGAHLIDTEFGPVAGAICFDLNFSELREQYKPLRPKLLLFSSVYHGGVAQNWWALDLRCWFVGSTYDKTPATIIDPQGTTLAESNSYIPWASARINLDFEVVHIDRHVEKFDRINARYGDEVRIVITGKVGTAVIYSESKKRTAMDIIREFKLMLLDDYFDWSRGLREKHLP
jgi:predicted amidohydrolase